MSESGLPVRLPSNTRSAFVALLLVCPLILQPSAARADAFVGGRPEAATVEARDASLDEVFGALVARFNIRYRTKVPLDRSINGSYSGSLSRVIARLLYGYDFLIRRDAGEFEVLILGTSAKSSAEVNPIPLPAAAANPRGKPEL